MTRRLSLLGNLGTYPTLGSRIAMDIPGETSKQVGATDRACRSPTLLREAKVESRVVFRVRHFSNADSMGPKGASRSPSRTTERSQKETHNLQDGLSHLAAAQKMRHQRVPTYGDPRTSSKVIVRSNSSHIPHKIAT